MDLLILDTFLLKPLKPDESGEILVPYATTENDNEIILLTHAGFTQLEHFHHKTENYKFDATFYVNPEALVKDRKAQVRNMARGCFV